MATIDSVIDLIHPSSEEQGVALGDTVFVIFDRAMDEASIHEGHFFVQTTANTVLSGPDLLLHQTNPILDLATDAEILASPGFQGVVPGTITFERIANSGLTTVSGIDTTGEGDLYRTKAIFTPTSNFAPDAQFTVYLAGDDDLTDSINTGIRSRTVYDKVTNSGNVGDGVVTFGGSYTGGETSDTYRITVTTSGVAGTARFSWYRDTDVLGIQSNVVTSANEILLDQGVTISFDQGIYDIGDQFDARIEAPTYFEGNFSWQFQTGSSSLVAVPTSTATTVTGEIAVSQATITSGVVFGITETLPSNRAIQQSTSLDEITVTFSKALDSDTVTSAAVNIIAEPANGDESLLATRTLKKDLTVDGTTLTIRIR